MLRPVLVAAAWVVATYAATVQQPNNNAANNALCSGVKKLVTGLRQQTHATSFCSSFLSLPTRTTTVTVTTTKPSFTTVFPTVTTTASPTVTAVSTSLATTSTQITVYSTATVTSLSTTVVATSTVYTSTITSLTTSVTTTTSTPTVNSVTTVSLAGCTAPVYPQKRSVGTGTLRQKQSVPKPACFNGYSAPSAISKACSCLCIPNPTSTRTVTSTTTKVSTTASTRTATLTSPVTVTSISIGTTTITVIVSATQTVTAVQTSSATVTTQMASTTVSTTVSTSTATAAPSVSVTTRYSNFALQASFNQQFGAIQNSVGGSGEGVYFSASDLATAATFSLQGTKLYYNDQIVNTYAAASGDYYVVVNRPYAAYGYPTDCSLQQPSFSGDGCVLDCTAGGGGIFTEGSGNDVDNYGGAWGLQGSTDRFTVYAVGQT